FHTRRSSDLVDGTLEYQSDAAGAYQAKHRRLADVDVPAQDRHGEESWQYLRNDPVQHDLRPAGPRRLDRLDLPLVYLLYGFRHQLADEADRPEGDGEDARHDAGAEYRDEEQGPDDRVQRARGDHAEAPDPQQDRMWRGVTGGDVRGRHGKQQRRQGSDRSYVNGLYE